MMYLINKGNHFCNHFPKPYFGKKVIAFSFMFDENAIYKLDSKEDQLDINKLFGVSFGLHHRNSIRIGWRSGEHGEILLYAYEYEGGRRTYCLIDKVLPGQMNWGKMVFDYENNSIKIYLDHNGDYVLAYESYFKFPKFKWGYYLFPYFGGNQTAPHDINIHLKFR